MKKFDLFIIVYCIIILLSVMYATQPLQALLAIKFDISVSEASLFTAVVLLSLAISPIFYGYILEKVNAKKMLLLSLFILFVTNIFLALSKTYESFMFFRIIEAVVSPAILTSLMSILANSNKEDIKRNMSIYVASTVFGGLIGRVMSGFIATSFSYEYVFYSLCFAIFLCIVLVFKLSYKGEANILKPKISDVFSILRDKRFILVYFIMFCMFFVFAGVLNVLPFRMKELSSTITEFEISLLYLGYGMGILVSLYSRKIILFFKGEKNTILMGVFVYIGTNIFLTTTNMMFFFALIFMLCLGMFTVHTVCTGLANSIKESQKSLTSGMYLTFYYLGGALGSFVPSIIYEYSSWNIMIYCFIAILIALFLVVYKAKRSKNFII